MFSATTFGKILRTIGIILLGLTAAFHLLGGIGTTCVALGAENYDSMAGIAPFKWLYQFFVIATLGIAICAIRCTIAFARSKEKSYRDALLVLIIGAVLTGIHVLSSQLLRGASMPNDVRLYLNILTLIVFLLFSIRPFREAMALGANPGDPIGGAGLGAAAIITGLCALSVYLWAGPTHTFDGINYADVWHVQLTIVGWSLILLGTGLIARYLFPTKESFDTPSAIEQV